MMKQFFDLKAKHPDAVLLFRCGDFYETYFNIFPVTSAQNWHTHDVSLPRNYQTELFYIWNPNF